MAETTDRAIAEAIRREFPKHNRAAYSMAKRTSETGVMLCPRAREIKEEFLKQNRKRENRTNKNRIYGRLPDELNARVAAKMARENIPSMQDLLIRLLTEWVEADNVAL